MSPGWYLRRLSRMGPAEIAGRAGDTARRYHWRYALPEPPYDRSPSWTVDTTFGMSTMDGISEAAAARLVASAERLMAGHAEYFGVTRDDMADPDWFRDPGTGKRADSASYTFDVAYRDEHAVGDIKRIWEPSRHQHLTVLAAAYALTGDERYADRVAAHLRSWWAANPPLRGVHWVSGIELGIRLLSWVWVRRLLEPWHGASALFEGNPVAVRQVWHHQRWLAAFPSRGSSANNHAVAEAAGQLAASCAFRWFPESARWRTRAVQRLDERLRRNTFGCGLNRELATEYHGLVLELGLAAAAETAAAGVTVPASTWLVLLRMTDALAAVVDCRGCPPRQGDGDDGHGLVLDGSGTDRWASLLATGAALFGARPWWPRPVADDVRTPLLATLASGAVPVTVTRAGRPERRPWNLADAGMTILRAPADYGTGEEIWCRCDGGPHGFLGIAAHAHADALSVEVRHAGVDVLADPGTCCYHTDAAWRRYFRSTLGHNTLRLAERDQSSPGGPFLWTRHARSRVLVASREDDGSSRWCAEHDGYSGGRARATHRRVVELDGARRELVISDRVVGNRNPCELAFHLGPSVTAELAGSTARLSWHGLDAVHTATVHLPPELSWTAHRGETAPPLGWYSPGFGKRVPATTLLGAGTAGGDGATGLTTVLRFSP